MGLWHPDTIDGMVAHQIDACPNCEPDRRPRVFVCAYHEGWLAAVEGLEGHAVIDGEARPLVTVRDWTGRYTHAVRPADGER